jgi:transcription initiation factor IIE alpha subunit
MYGLFYRYRFFYRDLPMLLARDPVLADEYRYNHNIKQKMISAIIDTLAEKGFIERVPGVEEKTRLLENIWIISEYRIAYLFSTGEEIRQDTVLQGVKNMIDLIYPFFSKAGQQDLQKISPE